MSSNIINSFQLEQRVAIVTGGAGLLAKKHAEAILELNAHVVLWDIDEAVHPVAQDLNLQYANRCMAQQVDITSSAAVNAAFKELLGRFSKIDILINNAACNPKVDSVGKQLSSRLENFSLEQWNKEIAVGLTGALICSQTIGAHMAANERGVIVNIASDLGLIAPDQRLYRVPSLPAEEQPVKPVTYSVIKHGLIGLTRYLASYWADKGVRCNALAPGGVYQDQPEDFVQRLTNLIPMGRMAQADEYKGAIQFLVSDASSYMTGAVLVMDGGRTCW